MNCKIQKSILSGMIICPTNKSYTHRCVFLSSLADGSSLIKNVLFSEDTKATIQACKKFGVKIEEFENELKIENPNSMINSCVIDAANSGTTIRISAAIAGLADGKSMLSGDESLNKRPMKPLLDALEGLGAHCTSNDGRSPISVTGKIIGGEISIPGNISSQFISALMIVAPKTAKGIKLNIDGELVSKPYLDATIHAMKKFGVKIQTLIPYKKYAIEPQEYKSTNITIPSDFSSLALLLSAAVLIGKNLKISITVGDLPQGDEAFIEILESLGAKITKNEKIVSVQSPEKLKGGKFDLANTPDLLPPLAVLALKTSNPIEIVNVKHARFKETDRIAILAKELSKLGIKVIEKDDGLILESPDHLTGAELNSQSDHRLFMAFCIAGMFVGNCKVSNPESVSVSYPKFVSDMIKVGASMEVLP